ncbi:MAG TPA: hypothetical protein VEU30_08475 [Thermoanaerobaculia bacterium]|nr:hypothetical protein [Thermoanaerobaculia bacterium]
MAVFGILATALGMAMVVVLAIIKRPIPNLTGAFVLFAVAGVLVVAGIWLVRLRRWAGLIIAALSLLIAVAYAVSLTRCGECSWRVLAGNAVFAALAALPGVLILRWRRLLR